MSPFTTHTTTELARLVEGYGGATIALLLIESGIEGIRWRGATWVRTGLTAAAEGRTPPTDVWVAVPAREPIMQVVVPRRRAPTAVPLSPRWCDMDEAKTDVTPQLMLVVRELNPDHGTNKGHGHVWARPDGIRMRCGGPRHCSTCARDAAGFVERAPTVEELRRALAAAEG